MAIDPNCNPSLSFVQGSTWMQTIFYNNPNNDDGTPGSPIDLTGYTAKLQVRAKQSVTSFLYLDIGTATGEIVITPLEGRIDITVSDTVTATLPVGTYFFELKLTSPSSVVISLLSGRITITPEVAN